MVPRTTRQVSALVLHPFLIALFPVLSLYTHNASQIAFSETFRALFCTLLICGVLFLLFGLAVRDFHRAGLAVTAVVFLFYSFGHVYLSLTERYPGSPWLRADLLVAVWAVGLIVLPWLCLRILPRLAARSLTLIFNVMGLSALVFALYPLVVLLGHNIAAGTPLVKSAPAETAGQAAPVSGSTTGVAAPDGAPDIYYIILDGYARSDVLRDFYQIQENPFLDYLTAQGFYIAEDSHSNYWRTALSVASSMNYAYMDDLLDLQPASRDTQPLEALIKDNRLIRELKSRGYTTVAFSTSFGFTDISDADVFYKADEDLNSFEAMLLIRSLALVWLDSQQPEQYRRIVHTTFAELAQTAMIPGPKVVFAHLVIPHPPFVFDQNGGPVKPMGSGDAQYYLGSVDSYLTGYRGQLLYTNRLAEQAVRAILAQSAQPPVIIIQGDHGPGAYMDFNSLENSCLRERYSILNAYYLPGKTPEEAGLTPDISPVNSFRVVLNAYFDAGLPLEDNRAYFSVWDTPYDLTDVTARLGECALYPQAGGPTTQEP